MKCPSCNHPLPQNAKFCPECGAAIPQNPFTSPVAATTAATEERRIVTVLFADLKGFTSLSERMDAEDVREIVSRLFQRFSSIISVNGGMVDKYIGDAVMAVFGAPEAHEDDAQRAIHSARSMQMELQRYNRELKRPGTLGDSPVFAIRIGINTGEAIWGRFADGADTVIGDAVNVASRLESLAAPGSIIVSASTQRLAADDFLFQKLQSLQVKGREQPVQPYLVVGGREFSPAPRGIHSPLVGRVAELDRLKDIYRSTGKDGLPRFVLVSAEAGLGKSRLIHEFRQYLEDAGDRVAVKMGRCPAFGAGPFAPFAEIIRSDCGIEAADTPELAARKVKDGYQAYVSAASSSEVTRRNWLQLIGQMIGAQSVQEEAGGVLPDSGRMREEGFLAFKKLLGAIAADRTLLLILEDLHWADCATLDLLSYLSGTLREGRIMIAATARPEFSGSDLALLFTDREKPENARLEVLILQPLEESSGLALIANSLEGDPGPGLVRLLQQRAGGNPLFIEELLRYLLDTNSLRAQGDEYELVPGAGIGGIPDSIHGLVLSRIDRLQKTEREVIKRASVIGRTFWDNILSDIAQKDVLDELQGLATREFIFPFGQSSIVDSVEYIFKHALIRDVAYNAVLKKTRRQLHQLIAQWLQQNVRDMTADVLGLIAYHYEMCDRPVEAGAAYASAGDRCANTPSASQAIEYYHKAFLLTAAPELLEKKADACQYTGKLTEAKSIQQQLLELLDRSSTDSALTALMSIRVRRKLADLHQMLGEMEKSEHYFQSILSKSKSALDEQKGWEWTRELAQAEIEFAWLRGEIQGRFTEARELSRAARERIQADTSAEDPHRQQNKFSLLAKIERNLANASWHQGKLEEALEHLLTARDYHGRAGNRSDEGRVTGNIGHVYWRKGDFGKALECYRQNMLVYQETGDKHGIALVSGNIAAAYLGMGDTDRALDYYGTALREFEEIGDQRQIGMAVGNTGDVYSYIGELDQALEYQERYLKISRQTGDKHGIGTACLSMGTVLGHKADWHNAQRNLAEAAAVAEEIGDGFMRADATIELGSLHAARGLVAQAGQHFAEAFQVATLEEMPDRWLQARIGQANLLRQQGQSRAAYVQHGKLLANAEQADLPEAMRVRLKMELARDLLKVRGSGEADAVRDTVELSKLLAGIEEADLENSEFLVQLEARYLQLACQIRLHGRENGKTQIQQLVTQAREKGYVTLAREIAEFQ